MKNSILTIHCLFILALFTILSGCAAQTGEKQVAAADAQPVEKLVFESDNQLETIRSRGTLRVGVSLFIPWIMHSNKGELIGYETDVARKLAEDMGVGVKFVQTSWPGIVTGLLTEKYDIIISGLSLTPQRALLINYSNPYSHSSSVLIASRKLAGRLITADQFNTSKVTIGIVQGSVSEELAGSKFPKAGLQAFDSESHAIAALLKGKIYAIISSTPKTGYLLSRHGKELFQPFSQPLSIHAEGFGIRKGDADFLNFLNTWIEYNTQNGWLARRHQYWFDTIDWADQL